MRRVVLEHHVSQWKVSCFAADRGLVFYDKIAETESNPEEVIWINRDATMRLHRLEDRFAGIAYVVLDGADEDDLEAEVIESLDGLALATLLDAIAADRGAAVHPPVIAALGVLAPSTFEQRVFDEFMLLLADPDPAVRGAAASAAAHPAWIELTPVLQRIADEDVDAEVRARAGVALTAFSRRLV